MRVPTGEWGEVGVTLEPGPSSLLLSEPRPSPLISVLIITQPEPWEGSRHPLRAISYTVPTGPRCEVPRDPRHEASGAGLQIQPRQRDAHGERWRLMLAGRNVVLARSELRELPITPSSIWIPPP